MEITIRSETPADAAAIREVTVAAFGGSAGADLIEAVRALPDFNPELSLVAEREGQIVGHALFSNVRVEGEGASVELLALGPIGVRPEWQKQGIGGQLIAVGRERAAALGYRAILLIGHPSYYPRFGFVPAGRFGLKSTFRVPDEVFMALPLFPDALDGIHGTVRYPAAFDDV